METVKVTKSRYEGLKVTHHDTEFLDRVARMAGALLEKNALMLLEDGGEDSAGRGQVRHAKAEAVVARAFDLAEQFYEAARARGHLIDIPADADETA